MKIKKMEKIYETYPRKMGKKQGFAKMQKLSHQSLEDLLSAVNNYNTYLEISNTEEKFIKYFSSFMSCWEDWLTLPVESKSAMDEFIEGDKK